VTSDERSWPLFLAFGCERQSQSRVSDRGHFFSSWVLGSWVSQSLSGVGTLCLAHASFHLALRTYVRDWEEDSEWSWDGICVIVWNCVHVCVWSGVFYEVVCSGEGGDVAYLIERCCRVLLTR
jgi:hypothetical protein